MAMWQRDWAWLRPRVASGVLGVLAILGAVALRLPAMASADPLPPVVPADPGAPPPPGPDAAPDPNRINVDAGGFSYELPDGWAVGDASKITYGQALLTKTSEPGAQPPTDTAIMLGTLDQRLFAGAEPDNAKAAVRLASDMGEFFMPFPGTRINRQAVALNAAGVVGSASYYEVKFTDTSKPNGQIWAAALGSASPHHGAQPAQNNRWFVVCLGTTDNPIDKAAAQALAESIRPLTAPGSAGQMPPEQNAGPVPASNNPPPPDASPPSDAPVPAGVPVPQPPNPETMPHS